MLIEQQPAFVLHARPYRETSLLLECLTRDQGRIGVVARGVRSQRGRLQRSLLEPFQPLLLDLQLRGELATLRSVESASAPLRLLGDAGLAGLYINELVVRLTERQDPHPELYAAYAQTLGRMAQEPPLAWQLRRFERDLLGALGYALQLSEDADSGGPLLAEALYIYRPEHGPVRCRSADPHAVRGSDLQSLQEDRLPDAQGLHALRGMMRALIRFHLGGVELRAWRVLRGAIVRR
ncbi:DNA repair protein RecO [Dyella caseinilytica]|uniref:DNA repair protein RecO n=1 Tax=Dyella caseinilytica TaxID=1849581 RepID=A0ABX7GXY4_9GAMM|nr:DNA repair protein RecO [Dyella caseinilytica]QRN55154.1 DNA repair protein RecO [Dyella caseinilytica]GFZ99753.1 DNA repair protein RecO [Dyella caseinilytica]